MRHSAQRHSETKSAVHRSQKIRIHLGDLNLKSTAVTLKSFRADPWIQHEHVIQLSYPRSMADVHDAVLGDDARISEITVDGFLERCQEIRECIKALRIACMVF